MQKRLAEAQPLDFSAMQIEIQQLRAEMITLPMTPFTLPKMIYPVQRLDLFAPMSLPILPSERVLYR